ncbi:MAG: amino acid permease-domain-containing protein [Monoraphidium minutum]|nr:MAG: amino acid permease-domain-containing protein [Monoraphidium minutum]
MGALADTPGGGAATDTADAAEGPQAPKDAAVAGGAAAPQFGTTSGGDENDDAKLLAMGYQPQLRRDFRLLTSFAISFTIVSILTGLTGLYGLGFAYGGPVVIIWGWPICVAFTTCIAAALAELCSAYPAAGGVYYWSWSVAPRRFRGLAAWLTLWLNLIGLVGVESGINYTFAVTLQAAVQMARPGWAATPAQLFGIYCGVTVCHALINTLPIHAIGVMNRVSIVWHLGAILAFCIALPCIAPAHQPPSYVFTKFNAADGAGITSLAHSLFLGTLMSQFTLTGYEASAKVAEESKDASRTAPLAIVLTVVTSGVVGWAYLLATTFSIQDPGSLLDPGNATRGANVFAQVLFDASMARFGRADAAVVLLALILPAQFFCGASCLTDGSRALFAFARDRAVPFPRAVAWVHPRTRVPVVTVWVMAAATVVIAAPMLGSLTAYTAVTSIATIGTYLSYGAPIALRLGTALCGCSTFEPGPISLGRWSVPVCAVATFWVLFITALFVLPTVQPVTAATLNYAGPLTGGVLLLVLLGWLLGARRYFDGPLTPPPGGGALEAPAAAVEAPAAATGGGGGAPGRGAKEV